MVVIPAAPCGGATAKARLVGLMRGVSGVALVDVMVAALGAAPDAVMAHGFGPVVGIYRVE